jgi:hypothetical protein
VNAPRRNRRNNALKTAATVRCGIPDDSSGEGQDFRPSAGGASDVARADCDRESSHEHALASTHASKALG